MQHDLNKYNLAQLRAVAIALTTGDNFTSNVVVDSASMGVILDISTLAGATSLTLTGQGSNDNGTTWTNLNTTGATSIVVVNLDTDTKKRVFSISSEGLFKLFRVKITIVGSPTGGIGAVAYQIPQDGVNINNNKR